MYAMDEDKKRGASPVKDAIKKVMSLLDGAEVGLLKNGGKPTKVEVEIEAGGHEEPDGDECPECLAGECDNPDHLKDEEMEGLTHHLMETTGDESKY